MNDALLVEVDKRQKAGELLKDMAMEYGVKAGSLKVILCRWRRRTNPAPSTTARTTRIVTKTRIKALTVAEESRARETGSLEQLYAGRISDLEDLVNSLARHIRFGGTRQRDGPKRDLVMASLAAEPKTYKEIAKETGLTESSVRNHVRKLVESGKASKETTKERRGVRVVSVTYVCLS